jgi:hypothetical protein
MRRGLAWGACIGAWAVLGCQVDNPGRPPYAFGPSPAVDAGPDAEDAAPPPPAQPELASPFGRWGMFAFEDPVAIDITGPFGIGCYAGLPDPQGWNERDECTPLEDVRGDGQHLEFAFMAETYRYAADVMFSTDATRMAGRFHGVGGWSTRTTSWLRLDDGEVWLKYHGEQAMLDALRPRGGGFVMLLEQGPVPGFERGIEYDLSLSVQGYGAYLAGDLGAFWGDEMRWNEEDEILSVGPVPVTDPSLAVSLTMDFRRGDTVWVVATWASGFSSTFAATPR